MVGSNTRYRIAQPIFVVLLLVASLIVGVPAAEASSYDIAVGSIGDHADPNEVGSIAWYFQTFGSGHDYRLADDAIYYVDQTLVIPNNTTLTKSVPSDWPSIRPSSTFTPAPNTDNSLIVMGSYTELLDLTIHGMQRAHVLVFAKSQTSVRVEGNRISDNKRDFPAGANPALDLIRISDSNWVYIEDNLLRRAGHGNAAGSKVNGLTWAGSGDAIHVPRNTNVVIRNNNIAFTLSAGVALGGTVGADISDNVIAYTGLNNDYTGSISQVSGDGITAYNNGLGVTDLNYYIYDNTISNYRNHGIHISGEDVLIQNNTITNGVHNAIRYAPSYQSNCTSDISRYGVIRWNTLADGSNPAYSAIRIFDHVAGTMTITGNTGGTTSWGSTCPDPGP